MIWLFLLGFLCGAAALAWIHAEGTASLFRSGHETTNKLKHCDLCLRIRVGLSAGVSAYLYQSQGDRHLLHATVWLT